MVRRQRHRSAALGHVTRRPSRDRSTTSSHRSTSEYLALHFQPVEQNVADKLFNFVFFFTCRLYQSLVLFTQLFGRYFEANRKRFLWIGLNFQPSHIFSSCRKHKITSYLKEYNTKLLSKTIMLLSVIKKSSRHYRSFKT